jgi:Zn-dependent peptidase ImmA (M78 family)/transcriptional regulator with XRE-family HTH domain
MPTERAIVKPDLLAWAREEAGLSLEDAAKKIAVKPEHLQACERNEAQLTVRQLRVLSNAYKRPLAFFYLPAPPARSTDLRDFRRPSEEEPEAESPRLKYEIRRARYRRRIALELSEELGEPIPEFTATATLADSPADVARRVRELLGVTRQQQRNFRDVYDALNTWRESIERLGVAVFQASRVPSREMLGFSISEPSLPVIVLNMSDVPVRRIFTMLHEFTHLMLRTGGLCTLKEVQQIEVFCNEVAGESLVPRAWLLDEPDISARGPQDEWPDGVIEAMGRRYRVSRETILRRLLEADYTSRAFYERKHEEYKAEFETTRPEDGFVPPYTLAVAEAGRMFIQLVLESYRQDKITTSEVSDFLEVRTKHFNRIAQAVENPTLELGAA